MGKIKKKIGVDIDEVLIEIMPALNRFYNFLHKTNFEIRDYVFYDLDKVWGVTKEKAVRTVNDFYDSSFFDDVFPVEGSQEAISSLAEIYELVAPTSRPDFIKTKTELQIKNFFGRKIKEIIFTGQYNLESSQIFKAGICLEKGILAIIEDNLEIAADCSAKGIKSFLLDRDEKTPWNQNHGRAREDGIIRVKSWSEIVENLK